MRHHAIVSLVFSSAFVLCGCEQPLAPRVDPAPADPAALARARQALRAMVVEYERPGSTFHAQAGQAFVRARAELGRTGAGAGESQRVSALRAIVRQLAGEDRAPTPQR